MDEISRRELAFIRDALKITDFSDDEKILAILKVANDKSIGKSPFGKRFVNRLNEIHSIDANDALCVVCNKKHARNLVICDTCCDLLQNKKAANTTQNDSKIEDNDKVQNKAKNYSSPKIVLPIIASLICCLVGFAGGYITKGLITPKAVTEDNVAFNITNDTSSNEVKEKSYNIDKKVDLVQDKVETIKTETDVAESEQTVGNIDDNVEDNLVYTKTIVGENLYKYANGSIESLMNEYADLNYIDNINIANDDKSIIFRVLDGGNIDQICITNTDVSFGGLKIGDSIEDAMQKLSDIGLTGMDELYWDAEQKSGVMLELDSNLAISRIMWGNMLIDDYIKEQLKKYEGSFYDSISSRCGMDIAIDGTTCYIDINWGGGYNSNAHWKFEGYYNMESRSILYRGAEIDEFYNDDGSKEETYVYTDGTGSIQKIDGIIYWDDYVENIGDGCTFVPYNKVY